MANGIAWTSLIVAIIALIIIIVVIGIIYAFRQFASTLHNVALGAVFLTVQEGNTTLNTDELLAGGSIQYIGRSSSPIY